MTLQQFLDGDLMIVLAGRDVDTFGYFNIYPSDNKLYISYGGGMQYRVDNVDTSASSAIYSELTIEKLNDATFTLNSVYVRTSDVEVFPQLPLVQTGANARMGELSFRGGITAQELLDGKYVFLLDDDGNPTAAKLQQGSGAAKVDFLLNGNVVINGTIRDGEILHLVATSEGGPSLVQIISAFDLEGGSLDPDSNTMIGENVKIWTPSRYSAYDERTETSELIGKCLITTDGIHVVGGTVPSDTVEGEAWAYMTLGLQGPLNNPSDISWPIRISDLNLADYPGGIINAYITIFNGELQIVVAKYNGEDPSRIAMPVRNFNLDQVENWGAQPPLFIGR